MVGVVLSSRCGQRRNCGSMGESRDSKVLGRVGWRLWQGGNLNSLSATKPKNAFDYIAHIKHAIDIGTYVSCE